MRLRRPHAFRIRTFGRADSQLTRWQWRLRLLKATTLAARPYQRACVHRELTHRPQSGRAILLPQYIDAFPHIFLRPCAASSLLPPHSVDCVHRIYLEPPQRLYYLHKVVEFCRHGSCRFVAGDHMLGRPRKPQTVFLTFVAWLPACVQPQRVVSTSRL